MNPTHPPASPAIFVCLANNHSHIRVPQGHPLCVPNLETLALVIFLFITQERHRFNVGYLCVFCVCVCARVICYVTL